ncbi:hypothetical protein KCU65_g9987, partial [Aureobasidium melanogenum]
MPSHPFLLSVRPDGSFTITADQLRTGRQSTSSPPCAHTRTGHFGPVVRIPGICESACASCEWKSHRSQCPCRSADEAFTPPAAPRALPPGLGGITM